MSLSVTVLICTSGRAAKLDGCLTALSEGTERPQQLVIVNGEDGETPAIVAAHASEFDETVLVVHPNQNLATLRNLGLPHCLGDVLAMTDDDAIPDREWVSAIRKAYSDHPDAGGIGGSVRGLRDSFVSRVADVVVFPVPAPGRTIFTLPTVNMSYRMDAVRDAGRFDETLFRGEDVDFNWRIVTAGSPIVFDAGMSVVHEHRTGLMTLYRQQWMYGRAYYLVRSKWPEMYAVYPHSLRSARSWLKLAHAGAAIIYQPVGLARKMRGVRNQLLAYPVLVIHHAVWKAGMLRQAILARREPEESPALVTPTLRRWVAGRLVPDEEPTESDSAS